MGGTAPRLDRIDTDGEETGPLCEGAVGALPRGGAARGHEGAPGARAAGEGRDVPPGGGAVPRAGGEVPEGGEGDEEGGGEVDEEGEIRIFEEVRWTIKENWERE